MKPQRAPEPPLEPHSPVAPLLQLLARLRQAHLAFVLRRLSWLCTIAALALFPVALAVVAFAGNPLVGARVVLGAGLLLLAAVGTRVGALAWLKLAPKPLLRPGPLAQEVARLQQLAPALGSSVASAVALAQAHAQSLRQAPAGAPGQASPSLVCAHLEATCRAVATAAPEAQLTRLRGLRLLPWRRACVRLVLLALVLAGVARTHTAQLLQSLRGQTPISASDTPLWADVEVCIEPPAYSQLPPLDWAPMGAKVVVLAGSRVAARGRADGQFRSGLVTWGSSGPQDSPEPWRPDAAGLWRTQAVVQAATVLQPVFIDARGLGRKDSVARMIEAVPDLPPKAVIDAPTTQVTLKDHEQFELSWRATDDLGLLEVQLLVTALDAPTDGTKAKPTPLPLVAGGPDGPGEPTALGFGVRRAGSITLSARTLGLLPGAGLQLQVQATDTAPTAHVELSAPIRVQLFSARAHHEALLARQEEALRSMVDWLALELATALGPTPARSASPVEALAAHVTSVAGTVHNLQLELHDDAMSDDGERLAWAHVAAHAAAARVALQQASPALLPLSFSAHSMLWRSPREPHIKRQHRLEEDILYLDALLAHSRLELLQDHVKDLLAAKAELQDLIARYRVTGDETLRQQLSARMHTLKDQVQGVLKKMAALGAGLPDGFRNSEANHQDPMSQTLERLDRAMQADDIDALAQDLEHMANLVDNAAVQLQERQEEQNAGRAETMRAQLQQLANTLEQLTQKQSAQRKQSAALAERALQEAARATATKAHKNSTHAAPQDGAQALQERLEAIAKQLDEAAHEGALALPALASAPGAYQSFKHGLDSLADAQDLLLARALPEAQTQLREGARMMAPVRSGYGPAHATALQHVRASQEATRAAQTALDELLQHAQQTLPEPLARAARALQQEQAALGQATRAAQAKAQQLSQDSPVMGEEAEQALGASAQAMGQAADALGTGQLAAGGRAQEAALAELRALSQQLGQSLQPSSSGGTRFMPRPMGAPRPNATPGAGTSGADTERDVAIPKADEAAPNSWREQLLDHAKQTPPKAYEEAVRRYYDGLMR